MAAPKTVFSRRDFRLKVNGTDHRACRLAKARSVYSNDATFLSRFKVDRVLHTKDGDGVDCVVGLLNESSSPNASYHASKRTSHLRIKSGNTGTLIMLTDAGLNTTPMPPSLTIHKIATNRAFFSYSYQDAYYLPSTDKINFTAFYGGTSYSFDIVTRSSTGMTSPVSSEKNYLLPPIGRGSYDIYISSTNDEGTKTSVISSTPTVNVYGPCRLIPVRKITSLSQDPSTGTLYYALIFYEDYESAPGYNLYQLFARSAGTSYTASNSLMNRTSSNDISTISWGTVLPSGIYYGFPTTYGGTGNKCVYIDGNGYSYMWNNSTYTASYTVTIHCSYYDLGGVASYGPFPLTLISNDVIINSNTSILETGNYSISNVNPNKVGNSAEITIDFTGVGWWPSDTVVDFSDDDLGAEVTINEPGYLTLPINNFKSRAVNGVIALNVSISAAQK